MLFCRSGMLDPLKPFVAVLLIVIIGNVGLLDGAPLREFRSTIIPPSAATMLEFCKRSGSGHYVIQERMDCHLYCPEQYKTGKSSVPEVRCCPKSLCYLLPAVEGKEGSCQPCFMLGVQGNTWNGRSETGLTLDNTDPCS
jgi:hypothetical protein